MPDPTRPPAADPGLSEDDFATLQGLTMAVEVCSDVITGLVDKERAKQALPTLVNLLRAEVARLAAEVAR
jgi:hypothetical protein